MSDVFSFLPLKSLENALQKLEEQINSLSLQNDATNVEQLSLALQKEQQKRETVVKILDETIDKVEKLVQASA